jgi:hypothetical protein
VMWLYSILFLTCICCLPALPWAFYICVQVLNHTKSSEIL